MEKQYQKNWKKKLYTIFKPHNEKLYKILGRKIKIWENKYKHILNKN